MLSTTLSAAALVVLFAVCIAALFSLVFGLPGTFIIAAAALLYAWLTDFAIIQWTTPLWLLGLAIAGEIVEFFITTAAASAAAERPSRRITLGTIGGAFIGGIVGTPFLFGIGSLLGAMAGAFLGAALAATSGGRDLRESLRIGFAALQGKLFGFVLKSAIAVTMIVIIAAAVWR